MGSKHGIWSGNEILEGIGRKKTLCGFGQLFLFNSTF
jgi:hypothetical protein